MPPGGGGGPEPHLSPHTPVAPDDGPGDVDGAAVSGLEGGGAGGGPGREVVEDAQLNVGAVEVLIGKEKILMMVFAVMSVMTEETIQWVQEGIVEWIMVSKEGPEEIEGI